LKKRNQSETIMESDFKNKDIPHWNPQLDKRQFVFPFLNGFTPDL